MLVYPARCEEGTLALSLLSAGVSIRKRLIVFSGEGPGECRSFASLLRLLSLSDSLLMLEEDEVEDGGGWCSRG